MRVMEGKMSVSLVIFKKFGTSFQLNLKMERVEGLKCYLKGQWLKC